jgi:hypothetical protein
MKLKAVVKNIILREDMEIVFIWREKGPKILSFVNDIMYPHPAQQ